MKNVNTRAWLSLGVLAVVMAALLFGAAGTVRYWEAWAYLSIFIGGSALMTFDLVINDPALLGRRMRGGPTGEKRPVQRLIMLCVSVGFMAQLVVAGLDKRFGWSTVPLAAVVTGDLLVAIGFFLIWLVYRANTFASATIDVAASQNVISSGPYAIVRHPMYFGGLLSLLGASLALGSYWAFAAVAAMIPFLIWRLIDEERLLVRSLPGYTDYQSRVPKRLVPFFW